jgi:hypothetical protein
MSRKTVSAPPFFATRGDFEASLAKFCEASLFLHQTCVTALQLNCVDPKVKDRLQGAADAWEKAAIRTEG